MQSTDHKRLPDWLVYSLLSWGVGMLYASVTVYIGFQQNAQGEFCSPLAELGFFAMTLDGVQCYLTPQPFLTFGLGAFIVGGFFQILVLICVFRERY